MALKNCSGAFPILAETQQLALQFSCIQTLQPGDAAEHARQVQAQGWSDQELLLLLEGVELYGDNWADIAEHVGTKSQVRVEAVAALPAPVQSHCCDAQAESPNQQAESGGGTTSHMDSLGNLLCGSVAFSSRTAIVTTHRKHVTVSHEDVTVAHEHA